MPNATITFKYNNKTGKKDILIDYDSDPSLLPHEHESGHRELVQKIIDLDQLAEEPGEAIIDRVDDEQKKIAETHDEKAIEKKSTVPGLKLREK